MKYYLIDKAKGEWTEANAPDEEMLNDLMGYAQAKGQELVTEAQFQKMTGIPSKRMRSEGVALGELSSGYARDPVAYAPQMKSSGFDVSGPKESAEGIAGVIAPATSYAASSGMSIPEQLGASVLDVGATLLGARIPQMVGRALASKTIPAFARAGGVIGSEAASGAIAGGAQQGYGRGGFDPTSAGVGGVAGGAFGGAGSVIKGLGAPAFKGLASELSGVAPEALEQFARGGAGRYAIQSAQTPAVISEAILSDLKNWDELIPESKKVTKALDGKAVNLNETIQSLTDSMNEIAGKKGVLSPTEQQAFNKLEAWRDNLASMPIEIGANEARKIRSQLDDAIDYRDPTVGQGSAALAEKAFKKASGSLRNELLAVGGEDYGDLMKEWSKKLEAKKDLESVLGTKLRTESNISNLFGANKNEQRKIVESFDRIFGRSYAEKIKNAAYAKKLGIPLDSEIPVSERLPAWTSQYTTGKSNTGLILAGATSGLGGVGISPALAPIAPIAATAWSPRAATATLTEMYNPSKVTQASQEVVRQAKTLEKSRQATEEKKKRKSSDYRP